MLASSTLLYAVHEFVCVTIKLSLYLHDYLRVGFDCAHYSLCVSVAAGFRLGG